MGCGEGARGFKINLLGLINDSWGNSKEGLGMSWTWDGWQGWEVTTVGRATKGMGGDHHNDDHHRDGHHRDGHQTL